MKVFKNIEEKIEIEIQLKDSSMLQFALSYPSSGKMKEYTKNETTLAHIDAIETNLADILGIDKEIVSNQIEWTTSIQVYNYYFDRIKERSKIIPPA